MPSRSKVIIGVEDNSGIEINITQKNVKGKKEIICARGNKSEFLKLPAIEDGNLKEHLLQSKCTYSSTYNHDQVTLEIENSAVKSYHTVDKRNGNSFTLTLKHSVPLEEFSLKIRRFDTEESGLWNLQKAFPEGFSLEFCKSAQKDGEKIKTCIDVVGSNIIIQVHSGSETKKGILIKPADLPDDIREILKDLLKSK